MRNVAIIEDELSAVEVLKDYIKRFTRESGIEFNVFHFNDAISFLTNYKANYDIVFMDIELPDMDGLTASKKLREYDQTVVIVFVTNMAQYAVKGYEVDALDFIVKPVSYYNFTLKLKRAIAYLNKTRNEKINITTEDGMICLGATEIKYVEIMKHNIIVHTVEKDYFSYGTLKKIEEQLLPLGFCRCNSCYLVNLRYVTAIREYTAILVGGDELRISQPKKKLFVKALNDYLGGGKI